MGCFLTMDYKLTDRLKQLRNTEPVKSLSVDVLTPSEWGKAWKMEAIERPDLLGELAGRRQLDPYYRVPDPWFELDERGYPPLDGWPPRDSGEVTPARPEHA